MKWNKEKFETFKNNMLFFAIYALCIVTIVYLFKLMTCSPFIAE